MTPNPMLEKRLGSVMSFAPTAGIVIDPSASMAQERTRGRSVGERHVNGLFRECRSVRSQESGVRSQGSGLTGAPGDSGDSGDSGLSADWCDWCDWLTGLTGVAASPQLVHCC